MNMSIQSLREERDAKAKEYRNILDKNTGVLSKEVKEQLDGLQASIDGLDESIAYREKAIQDKLNDEVVMQAADALNKNGVDKKDRVSSCYAKWLAGGDTALSAEDWQFLNTMSTTTPSEGGYTVPTEVASSIIEALKFYGGMREAAQVITTATGAPMNMPSSDGTAEVGEILAQNTAAADADPSFGVVALPVYKFSSKTVAVPIELLQDSNVNIQAFVNARLAARLGRIQNTYFTTGTGSGQPSGIVTGLSAGKTGASGQTTTVTYADLVDLEHSVDIAYRRMGAKWMFHDSTLKAIKKLVDGESRPLWLPDVAGMAPATILGHNYVINNDVAVMAAEAKSILFGALKMFVIRDAMGIDMMRFTDSAYAKKGQVGFLAFMRSGSVNTDVSAIKYYANAAS